MKKHPAPNHLLDREFTLGKQGDWLAALERLDRWKKATQAIDDIAIPLIWPYAWTILTNSAEAMENPREPPPVYLVWIEPDHIRYKELTDILMMYWWLLDRANIRFLVFSLRKKPKSRWAARAKGPLVSPWWDPVNLMEQWIRYGCNPRQN